MTLADYIGGIKSFHALRVCFIKILFLFSFLLYICLVACVGACVYMGDGVNALLLQLYTYLR